MLVLLFFFALLICAFFGFRWAQSTALASVRGDERKRSLASNSFGLQALPSFYGQRTVYFILIPTIVLMILWSLTEGRFINLAIDWSLPGSIDRSDKGLYLTIVSQIKRSALGEAIVLDQAYLAAKGWVVALQWFGNIGIYFLLGLVALAGLGLGVASSKASLPARTSVERWNTTIMFVASCAAILITVGIVLSLIFQAFSFFSQYPIWDFLTGTRWSPGGAFQRGYGEEATGGVFGVVPLVVGTLLISSIAMMVAIPVGLLSAIYLSEYASETARTWLKPILEILAGIPTVVYGLFAALTFTPWIKDAVGGLNSLTGLVGIPAIETGTDIALAAGIVMGTMIIPFVASLSDDAIQAVPTSLRDGALGLGSTRSEMIRRVVLPAALPGISGGILLAVSRAIGETMIVVMAAGTFAFLTVNPFASVSTFTVQINSLLTGDLDFGGTKVLSAFAIGLFLFLVTLVLNTLALVIVRYYREEYD